MHSMRSFWNDEAGSIVSAELVTIGAVVTVGAVAGLQTASTAVNDELRDVSRAIRNLDQSYSYCGFRGCNSMTAGSAFLDTSVDVMGDRPANPPEAIQPRPSAPSSAAPPDSDELDGDIDESESLKFDDNEPVTAADAKLDA
jgi:Flp pilus assembly pilin Flp